MSNVWNEGYFTDVGYTYGYYREISPAFQRFCLLLAGFEGPVSDNPYHCELGFGQGVSVNVHAASNPGSYFATDFNPLQVAYARSLAAGNPREVRLYDDSFEQFLNRTDLPQFDTISLHGIWTWVSRDNHKVIAEFVRRHLKPGGTLYNSYNCFPGWSAAYPLRQIFSIHDRYSASNQDALKRVDTALKFTDRLFETKPKYLSSVVGLEDRLKKIMGQDKAYLAHEYFNREWNCMYFTDVVEALGPSKVDFATSANPFDRVDAINLTADAIKFLSEIEHPVMREQVRDYYINQQFRRDIFMRGAPRLTNATQRIKLLETRFVLTVPAESVNLKINTPLGEANLQPEIYKPIIDVMASVGYSPKSLKELAAALVHINFESLLQALIILTGMNQVMPCQPEHQVKSVRKSSDAFNSHLLQLGQSAKAVAVLASPVTGTGIAVDRVTQLFVLAQHKKSPDPVQFAWQSLQSVGEVLLKDGKPLQTAEANLEELKVRHAEFAKPAPLFKALQLM